MPRRTRYGQFTADRSYWTAVAIYGRDTLVHGEAADAVISTYYLDTSSNNFIVEWGTGVVKDMLVKVNLSVVRARMGNNPIVLSCKLRGFSDGTQGNGMTVAIRKILAAGVDWADLSNRYKDVSAVSTWYGDAYTPMPGVDVDEAAISTLLVTVPLGTTAAAGAPDHEWEIAADFVRELQRTIDIPLHFSAATLIASRYTRISWELATGKFPYLDVLHMNEVEFLQCDTAGAPDLSTIEGTYGTEQYYLDATERGLTASPVMGAVKNFSRRDIALIELLDDHPEVGDPLLESGTGDLFVTYAEAATGAYSQKYTVKITSTVGAGTFEVKAESWLDYELSLHPSYDSDSDWEGTPGTLWVATSGGFSIPAEAWQILNGEIAINKEISFLVRGDTSDTSYPADSNQQIEIARDNGASLPDSATWRDLRGRRIKTSAAVTIDATTKKIPVRHIDPTDWPTGSLCFLGDGTNLHEGAVASAATATVGAATLTGAGLDDITVTGNYKGVEPESNLYVYVVSAAAPDTIKWGIGASYPPSWSSPINCPTTDTYLADGLAIACGANTGHSADEYWTVQLHCDYLEMESLADDSTVYAVNSRAGTGLPLENLAAAKWHGTNAASGASEGQPDRIYMDRPDLAGFAAPSQVYIQDLVDPTLYETHTIQSVATTYIDLTGNLVNDYAIGAFVSQVGGDEIKFHLRLNPSLTTAEEMKLVRLACRY